MVVLTEAEVCREERPASILTAASSLGATIGLGVGLSRATYQDHHVVCTSIERNDWGTRHVVELVTLAVLVSQWGNICPLTQHLVWLPRSARSRQLVQALCGAGTETFGVCSSIVKQVLVVLVHSSTCPPLFYTKHITAVLGVKNWQYRARKVNFFGCQGMNHNYSHWLFSTAIAYNGGTNTPQQHRTECI